MRAVPGAGGSGCRKTSGRTKEMPGRKGGWTCLSPRTLRTLPGVGRHPIVPTRVESSAAAPGTKVPWRCRHAQGPAALSSLPGCGWLPRQGPGRLRPLWAGCPRPRWCLAGCDRTRTRPTTDAGQPVAARLSFPGPHPVERYGLGERHEPVRYRQLHPHLRLHHRDQRRSGRDHPRDHPERWNRPYRGWQGAQR
jgi:hypothetical protein